MDAIFGIWQLDGTPVDDSTMRRMASSLGSAPSRQRALSIQSAGPIGFGRLTIGRGAAEQPPTREGNVLCVADARLYRAPDTSMPLDLATAEREHLLCRLHAEFGDEAPTHIEGDFAYVIWDEKRQHLSLVRDHVGVRPLFYYHVPGKSFVWASHSEMLTRSGLIPNAFDLKAAVDSFVFDTPEPEKTLVPGLRRLPPAHVLHMSSNGDLKTHRYWALGCVDPITDDSRFEECASELRRLLDEAVQRRLPKHETIGAHMSGGLDSTAISVLAARALGRESRHLRTYSFVSELRPDVRFVDERPYVDATTQGEPNIYNTKITPSDRDDAYIDAWADRMAGFTGTEDKILDAADRDAVDVILSGWGGDEIVTFNGRGAYAEHFIRGRWRMLWRELKARSSLYRLSKTRVFRNEILTYVLPDWLQNGLRRAAGKTTAVMADEVRTQFLRPSFQKRHGGIWLGASTRRNRLRLFHGPHVAYRLENWAMQGAEHGVQYTFPMLDRELLEYAIRLPASFFLRHGVRRALFREAMQDVLPESVRMRRPKFAPFPCSLLRLAERKPEYLRRLEDLRKNPEMSGLLDFDAIEQALRKVPDPEDVKDAFNAEAAGGPSLSLAPTLAWEPVAFARFLEDRLSSK